MVGKRGFLVALVAVVIIAIIILFSWFFWPSVEDSSQEEGENTDIKGDNNSYESSQSNDREYSLVHLENADMVHGWLIAIIFLLMILAGSGAVGHQRKVAAPHRERLEEGIEELKGVLIDRGYIQARKKRRSLTKKQKKAIRKVKKLQGQLKNVLEHSEEEEESENL